MGRMFISYRRSQFFVADRLRIEIEKRTDCTVFIDTHIREEDFEQVITREIESCDVFALVVTPETFDPERIHDPRDWIHREVAMALGSLLPSDARNEEPIVHSDPSPIHDPGGKPIVLILVEGCKLPSESSLPQAIQKITKKQGIEIHHNLLEESIERLIEHCRDIAPNTIIRKPSKFHPDDTQFELRLKESVRGAIGQLADQIVRSLRHADAGATADAQAYNAWTSAEGLLALLYTESSPLADHAASRLDEVVIARLARMLTHADEGIAGGGIPASPEFPVANRGVVDSTAKVISALCYLRLHMYHHGYDRLPEPGAVTLDEVSACIDRLMCWLLEQQNTESTGGGWGLWKGARSRVTATAFAAIACLDAGMDPEEPPLQDALKWLESIQRDDGWWSYIPNLPQGDVTSTAFAIATLSMLGKSINNESIQNGVAALEANVNWDDAVHVVEFDSGEGITTVSMMHASEPRAVYALLFSGASPMSPSILRALDSLIKAELHTGGWTGKNAGKNASSRRMDVSYTYVVVESIYAWFTHSSHISHLVRLSRLDRALIGLASSYSAKQAQVGKLTHQLAEIQKILTS